MIENRALTLDDYLAMLRRRLKVILIPVVLAPVAGWLISYAFPAKYTSQALVMVEGQKVPQGYVQPVVSDDLTQRVATLEQQVLSRDRLQPLIERLGLAQDGRSLDEAVEEIRRNVSIEPVERGLGSLAGGNKKRKPVPGSDLPGFYVNFTAGNPGQAQQICSELTSMLLAENLKSREQMAQGTTEFLSQQVAEAKKKLEDLDARLAAFKRQNMGQLPGDQDNNIKMLMGLSSQLDAVTQNLARAQQDKTYAESMLAQQLATWKSARSGNNAQTLEQQLSALQSQLLQLQARYTDDHPDVIKAKADIAAAKKRLAEMSAAADQGSDKAGANEPPEIRQLRLQIRQHEDAIAQASAQQKRLQEQIRQYQGRMTGSPAVEEQYKRLTRDYDTAQKFYSDLLAKKNSSEMATDMERRQQGEQMQLLNPASLPESPSSPRRLLFAGGGLGGGLVLGLGIALWLELRDKAIRTEQDVEAVLGLPLLVSVPWLTEDGEHRNGDRRFRDRPKPQAKDKKKATVEV
jgi:polysaccharide chain length determinant protein (PEP-CTERM system associated)